MIMLSRIYITQLILIIFLFNNKCAAEEYNLYGEAGQAYAIEIILGNPGQKLNVIVDTGSATLAVASYPRPDSNIYFHIENSTTIYENGKEVQAKYSQGTWVGKLVSDLVHFPSLPSVPEVRCDIALITKSHKFFMNGSGWQGLLGLAYLPVGAWGENVIVGSWLDSVDHMLNKPMSFELKLCGAQGSTNATHYGNLGVLDDQEIVKDKNVMFRTPILRKHWFVIGVLSIRVLTDATVPFIASNMSNVGSVSKSTKETNGKVLNEINEETCQRLNEQKSIVDSGTTNIRLPDEMFSKVVSELRNAARTTNVLILDEFWYQGESNLPEIKFKDYLAACWPEPQEWSLPWLAIDLLDSDAENQFFTLEIPPQNYMRIVSARNNSGESGTVSEFCYKLGIEAGGKETVLGYTAMEGLQVLFNRSAGWIGWQTSNCGPNARVSGPYNTSTSLLVRCKLIEPISDSAISIKAAQWTLFVISIIALGVLVYLLAPCIKMFILKPLPRSQQISLSQAALVEQEAY